MLRATGLGTTCPGVVLGEGEGLQVAVGGPSTRMGSSWVLGKAGTSILG